MTYVSKLLFKLFNNKIIFSLLNNFKFYDLCFVSMFFFTYNLIFFSLFRFKKIIIRDF